jgi:hypothetical protein
MEGAGSRSGHTIMNAIRIRNTAAGSGLGNMGFLVRLFSYDFRDFFSFSQLADLFCRRCWLLPGSPGSSSSSAAIHWAALLPPSSQLSSYWSATSKGIGQDFFKAELREIHICFISQIEVSFTGNTRIWTGVHQEILFCYFLLVYKTLHRTF